VVNARIQAGNPGGEAVSETALSETTGGEAEGFVYGYRPKMVGSARWFRLGPHSLEWNMGGYTGQVPYPMIGTVRLGYRPSNFGGRRFVAEIWPRKGLKLELASTSYKSMVATEDQGPAYRVFLEELHRRIAAAGGDCRFEAGFAPWRWWPMAAVSVGTALALVYVTVTTLFDADKSSLLLVVGFMVLFGWQMWPLISRNRPERYHPRHIPERVLP